MIDGDSATGEFDDVPQIPVTFNAEHVLSATIEWGDMKFTYSVKEDKFDESCFDGTNNKVTITNNSTCNIWHKIRWNTDETYSEVLEECGFGLYGSNKNGQQNTTMYNNKLYYPGNKDSDLYSVDYYLTVRKDSNIETMHGYNFNDVKIGEITIEMGRSQY